MKTISWENGSLVILDQTLLPTEERYVVLESVGDVHRAICRLEVRGAPAIGVAAAFGLYLAVRHGSFTDYNSLLRELRQAADYLASSRPTAVNLAWALKRLMAASEKMAGAEPEKVKRALLDEALAVMEEDRQVCRALGRHGQKLLADGASVLTHCNAGGLATVDYGTALAVVYAAVEAGKKVRVYADETRPLLQGARLTAWELQKSGVPVTVICDGTAATVMARGLLDCVITGADRIAASGDAANKIGTYGLAVLARAHDIPFYIAAPLSSFDFTLSSGDEIPIEERDPDEVRRFRGLPTTPPGVAVFNPAFDVTPHRYITAFITERGVIRPPFAEGLAELARP
ncbi:MAG TPA: S-methyl-5-thioribose-1-phosphate isomerase [Candidatus Coatesbacteria bacterium]|nr:S-methyl-5-thioribose-1-phosphate isomerase [Candidatus Coatesbacteria bacterium]